MIRIAREEDSSDIAALSIQVWLATYAKQGIRAVISNYVLTEFTQEKILQKLKSNNEICFVAFHDEYLIGFVSLNMAAECPITSQVRPEIDKLYIQENFTAQGVGSKMLDSAIEYCRTNGHEQLWLMVNHENVRAQKFYQKHGFCEIGVKDFKLDDERHKDHVMSKSIM